MALEGGGGYDWVQIPGISYLCPLETCTHARYMPAHTQPKALHWRSLICIFQNTSGFQNTSAPGMLPRCRYESPSCGRLSRRKFRRAANALLPLSLAARCGLLAAMCNVHTTALSAGFPTSAHSKHDRTHTSESRPEMRFFVRTLHGFACAALACARAREIYREFARELAHCSPGPKHA